GRLSPPPSGAMWRLGSPSCGSILITCAPPSASACPAHGTAMKWPNSSTVTPANGWLISLRGAPRSLAYALAPGLSPAAADTSTRGHTDLTLRGGQFGWPENLQAPP